LGDQLCRKISALRDMDLTRDVVFMTGDKPEGGRWNYDAKNRKKLPRNFPIPPGLRFVPDTTTRTYIGIF
jgi:deoxyribodipyrimidine photolyase-like uncharacterized protein